MSEATTRSHLAATFWGAVLLSVILVFIPGGKYALYPFRLLGTWAHEMGHGLMALVCGGDFQNLELFRDLGGVAHFTYPGGTFTVPLVCAAGLLGPALLGGLVVMLGSRPASARYVTGGLAILLVITLVVWVRNAFGVPAVALLAASLGATAVWAPESLRLVVAQMIGIQLCLASVGDVNYMFTDYFDRDGQRLASDTQQIADHLVLPYWVWGTLIMFASLVILGGAFYAAWMRDEK
jgi:hypothetical protein